MGWTGGLRVLSPWKASGGPHTFRHARADISSGVTVQNEQETFFSLGKNGVNEYVRTADGRFVLREGGEKLRVLNDDHQGATPEKNIADKTAKPEEARVHSGE